MKQLFRSSRVKLSFEVFRPLFFGNLPNGNRKASFRLRV
jgi:hypothetical protein